MFKRILTRSYTTRTITFFYFFLLLYTVAALIWWGILLYQQNNQIMELERQVLTLKTTSPAVYQQESARIQKDKKLHELQYIGEGGTFLVIILLSAGFVFRAVRRQIRLVRQQQNFMAAVTHELKSPIAVIRLNLETLQKHELDQEKKARFLGNTIGELNRLNQLCNNMLLASQFDSHEYQLVKEKINFSELLEKTVHQSTNRMAKHVIQAAISPDLFIRGDQFMLQIVVNNLLENASKYAPPGTAINVVLRTEGNKAKLQIADEGVGIPKEERDRIFTRFYRIGNENTRKAKGTGLGLFLTQKIIQQHNGNIAVLDNKPKGSIFEVTLPLINS